MSVTEQPRGARYEGNVVVTFLGDGRRVQMVQRFAYIDNADVRWDVPVGATVDGASIPRPLWSLIGGPFEGKYRNASIIHDWYCDLRTRSWQTVHRVFYEAMLTSGVSVTLAKIMYGAVFWGGPRWSKTVVSNAGLASDERYSHHKPYRQSRQQDVDQGAEASPGLELELEDEDMVDEMPSEPVMEEQDTAPFHYDLDEADLKRLAQTIEEQNLDLAGIEEFVTRQVEGAKENKL